jgi:AraC family carnitine catabolism transcriptional activator
VTLPITYLMKYDKKTAIIIRSSHKKRVQINRMEQTPHRLALIVLPDFSNLGLALAIEPLFVANWLSQRRLFDWSVLSVDGLSVKASNGMRVPVDGAIGETADFETAIVLASFNVKQHAEDQRVLGWLRRMSRFGITLGAIETGSEIQAAAGLLDGYQAAVHWDNLDGFRERYPKVEATAQLYTISRERLTCAGATAILDMMARWIGQTVDDGLAAEVAQHLLMSSRRPPLQEQGAPDIAKDAVANQAVSRALAIMQETIEEPISCAALAAQVGLSQRQLQRHFQRHRGTTIARDYLLLRLARAHKLLQQTDLPVTEIAISAGFASLENFSRTYRQIFGCSPSADRQQSISAPVFRHQRSR